MYQILYEFYIIIRIVTGPLSLPCHVQITNKSGYLIGSLKCSRYNLHVRVVGATSDSVVSSISKRATVLVVTNSRYT